jgi:hypothetical protein
MKHGSRNSMTITVKLRMTKMPPYPKPVFMMHKTHMVEIHYDPLVLGDKF